jgi:hypothetical protein
MGEHIPDANAGQRDRGPDGLPVRPPDVRGGSGDGHALVERLRLARHRRAWPSRCHRDVRRRHTPRQRASTDVLARRQHRSRRGHRRRRERRPNPNPNPNLNPGLNTTDLPRIGPRTPAPPPLSRRPHSRKARARGTAFSRPANVLSDLPSYATYTVAGNGNGVPDGSSTTLDPLGRTLYLLFYVSMHEHAWMAGVYGVWGKERCLERFWTCLDWEAVRDAYVMLVRPQHY